ncbi:MAG TPA: helix-turn-helix transcriptional regulator [Actinocrinis sp.]|jgi:hypothetical protein|nr:helix-turn-helix transcriptional regulator [Actinocrinis sp.]
MPFQARQLEPAGSAQARLGAQLRRLRDDRSLSQVRLGAAINYSPDHIRRVEAAERFPTRPFIDACDRALDAGGALVQLWPAADLERRRAGGRRGSVGSVAGPRFDPGRSNFMIEQWAAQRLAGSSPNGSHSQLRVTGEEVMVAQDMLEMFRRLDHTHGAGQFATHLTAYVDTEVASLLARPVADGTVAAGRGRVAAGFFELAGYQAVDSGRPGWAQTYYGRALALTGQAADRGYGGYLVAANLAHLALHCGQPTIALSWAQTGLGGAGTAASPGTRAAITAVAARAYARLGAERETTAMLTQAETLLDAAVPADEPSWIAYFNRGYLADEMAHCFHDLGRPPAARRQVAEALDGVGSTHVRRLAIDAALLASTWLRSGDLEQACLVGRDAVGYAARTSSGRCIERVAQLVTDLAPFASTRVVAEFEDFVGAVLPAATRLVSPSAA